MAGLVVVPTCLPFGLMTSKWGAKELVVINPSLSLFYSSRSVPILSSAAVLIGVLIGQNVCADDTGETKTDKKPVQEVIVVGSKRSLMNAQDIKRDADTMVDAISADDIGALPDRSVLDAMQRLPGVAIERFAGPDDPDHFSVEASGVVLRGMTQTRSEFNGRDSFTANTGRGLSFQDVSPELMGSVEIYKNQTADMIEGGIGGTISLNTRKPFDTDEQSFAFSGDYSYGDLAKEWSPSYSALYNDVWNTSVGKFGVLVNYANSTLFGQSNGIQSDAFTQYYASDLPGAELFLTDVEVDTLAAAAVAGDSESQIRRSLRELDDRGIVWIPNASNLLIKDDKREREGMALALQFANVDETLEASFQFMRSDARLSWNERAIKYQGGYYDITKRQTTPLEGTEFSFDDQGLFQSGVLVNSGDTWRIANKGTNHVPRPQGDLYKQWGQKTQMDSRVNDLRTLIEDFAFNVKWQPSQQFELVVDYQYIEAETRNDDVAVHINTWAGYDYDISGSIPHLTLIEPWFGVRDDARANGDDTYEGGFPGFSNDPAGDSNYFQDPDSYLWTSAMDHYERSDGHSEALRIDTTFQFDNSTPLSAIKAGIRYANREQVVRYTQWNWGETTAAWDGSANGVGWLTRLVEQQDGYEAVDWSNFMHGGVVDIPGNKTFHASEAFIRSISGKNPEREMIVGTNERTQYWVPYPKRDTTEDLRVRRPLDEKYGIFSPGEMNITDEKRNAIYVRLDFGGDGELPYSGNIGLRYLDMGRDAIGAVVFPNLIIDESRSAEFPLPESLSQPINPEAAMAYFQSKVDEGVYVSIDAALNSRENRWIFDELNYISDADKGFANAHEQVSKAHTNSHEFLPSFNIKVDLATDLVGRFAFAKALAFPDMDDVRNRIILDAGGLKINRESEDSSLPLEDRLIQSTEVDGWAGGGGNPFIQPMKSVQYDFSLEWYFSDFGQLSASVFHKNLSNYFVQGVTQQVFTNEISDVTNVAHVTSGRNGGKGKLDGVEISYHQFFEGIFDGFGVQSTYTFVDATGVPNDEVDVENERWFDSRFEDTGIRVNLDLMPLEGQSDHTVNLIGMYEKGGWNARLGYNWRSRYLLTTRDVISKAPQWYDDHGELNGSIFYDIDDHFTVGLQATNITNARSDIIMILNDDFLTTGRSWFMSDRRVALVLRGQF